MVLLKYILTCVTRKQDCCIRLQNKNSRLKTTVTYKKTPNSVRMRNFTQDQNEIIAEKNPTLPPKPLP